ncbi:MAG: glutamate--tRNA ligase [Patescibacteria group bacterium]|nr:glutamate--tRNA ligase [Patescibacteria group bacterium]
MPTNIRVRFAPSPTGFLHIGSLRTVLFDYLIAKTLKGKLILRVEDTDQKREIPGAAESLINILDWVGIKFDEGPHIGGKFGPYTQSERMEIYKEYTDLLLKKGVVYRCFCSEERLKEMREKQQADKLPPRYDRACRDLTDAEARNRIKAGEKFVIRQKMPLDGEVVVRDELRGDIKFEARDLEDQILIKSDGMPTYQFANVVDDHLMEISHVLRGDEWISSFPKNILLYKVFGWEAPKFIHLPLTLNKEGGKLSKRQGDVAVEDYRSKGYLPEALLNFCVLQGWHPSASAKAPSDKKDEILNLEEMIKYFDYKDMGTSPAIFDIEKLDYFNGYYIRQMSLEKLTKLCLPFMGENLKLTKDPRKQSDDYIKKAIGLEQERLKKLSEIGELTEFFFKDETDYEVKLLIWKKLEAGQVKENLQVIYDLLEKIAESDWLKEIIEKDIISYLKEKELKVGDYLWPTRVALTGREASPGPFEVAEVLGKEESLKRLNLAIKKL